MTGDILTVARKEWQELLWPGGSIRAGRISLVILLFMFGVFMPYQFGPSWIDSPGTLFYWGWLPLMIVSSAVADSFAGERERHTLETLLASRLPDRAILLGKIVAAVGYAWGLVIAMLVIGLVTVNLAHGNGEPLFFPRRMAIGAPLLSLLGSLIAAGAGVLVSLRAPTVRQAAQTLNVAVLIMVFLPVLAIQALPAGWKAQLSAWAATVGADGILWAISAALAVVAAALIALALGRFRRARLALD